MLYKKSYGLLAIIFILLTILLITHLFSIKLLGCGQSTSVPPHGDDDIAAAHYYGEYRNWVIRGYEDSQNFKFGSTLFIANKQNPSTWTVVDDDNGNIIYTSISRRTSSLSGKENIGCNKNRVVLGFKKDERNSIDFFSLYEISEETGIMYKVFIQKNGNGEWEVTKKEKVSC